MMKIMTIIDENDRVIQYEILCTFKWIKTNKDYIIFKELNSSKVNAAIFYPDDNTRLDNIETELEWKEINRRIEELNNAKSL